MLGIDNVEPYSKLLLEKTTSRNGFKLQEFKNSVFVSSPI